MPKEKNIKIFLQDVLEASEKITNYGSVNLSVGESKAIGILGIKP